MVMLIIIKIKLGLNLEILIILQNGSKTDLRNLNNTLVKTTLNCHRQIVKVSAQKWKA